MIGLSPPENWVAKRLGEIAEIERESVIPEAISSGTSYLGLEHLGSDGNIIAIQAVENGDLASNKFRFTPSHILYGKLRPYLSKIVRPDFEGVCSTDILPIRPKPIVNKDYLYFYIRHPRMVELASARSEGANLPRLSPTQLEHFPIFLPPTMQEQQRIAAILDKADAIRRKRQSASGLADSLVRASFFQMFGDPVANSRRWPLTRLSSYGQVLTGNTPSRSHPEYYGDAIEWIKSDNINTPHHFLTRAIEGLSSEGLRVGRSVPSGSTLVTCIAGSPECIGNAALADREVAFNQQINAITPYAQTDPYFLYALITMSKRLIQLCSSEAMKGMVSKSRFESISVIDVPSDSQKDFGRCFQKLMTLSSKLDAGRSGSEELFASLSQRAFRGCL